MNETSLPFKYFETIAMAFERLTEFKRTLWSVTGPDTVGSGANIRNYQSGWRIEKYVEWELDASEALVACWFLEIGAVDDKWLVETHVSISHSDHYEQISQKYATTFVEFQSELSNAVDELMRTMEEGQPFRKVIDHISAKKN